MGLAFALLSDTARGADTDVPKEQALTPRVELRRDPWIDVPLTLALAGGIVATSQTRSSLGLSKCRICDGAPGELNGVDDAFRRLVRREDDHPAAVVSDVFGFGIAPAAAIGLGAGVAAADKRTSEIPVNVLLVAEATVSAMAVTEVLKTVFLRERPYAHAITDEEQRSATLANSEALASFPSGHATATFAMAASTGTVATLRGYRLAPMTWGVGMMIAVATSYFRMAADRHYFTDVVVGGGIGTLVGAGVPLLFHGPMQRMHVAEKLPWLGKLTLSPLPSAGGRGVSVGMSF